MSRNQVLTIFGILATCGTALLVGYWHRKQLRQIEAYRADNSSGLVPPPSPVWTFLKRYRSLLIGLGLPGITIVGTLRGSDQLTRGSVLVIALSAAAIYFALTIELLRGVLLLFERHIEATRQNIEATRELTDLSGRQVKIVETILGRGTGENSEGPKIGGA